MSHYNMLDMSKNTSNILSFPPVTKQRALRIAAHATHLGSHQLSCYSQLPNECSIRNIKPVEPCWYILAPTSDQPSCMDYNRLLIISRENGSILYDGPAIGIPEA
jgi:hypothetical protein